MRNIQELVENFEKTYKVEEKSLDIQALEQFLLLQKEDTFLQKFPVLGVHRGVLLLQAKNSMEQFSIIMKKTELLNKINTLTKSKILKDIRIAIYTDL